ncbi:MAG: N-acetyltransferase [Planctomycetaceae bacterium]|nr:N-acetyltransferase [Planctomycetaceae bacterium]
MNYSITPTAECHFLGLHQALDVVARELQFLALTAAPPWEDSLAYYRNIIAIDFPHFVALDDEKVVGWCDVAPVFGQSRAHVGVIGIALLPEARHKGLGTPLMQAAITKGWARGLTRLELTVRADNLNAIKLYEKLGFEHEGVRRRGSFVQGQYYDVCCMGLLRLDDL